MQEAHFAAPFMGTGQCLDTLNRVLAALSPGHSFRDSLQELLAALAQLPGSRIERTVDDKPSQHSHHQGEQQHQRPQPSLDGGGSQAGYDSLQGLFLP